MKFIRQIKIEIQNILRSRFLLIIGILLLAASIVMPVISVIARNSREQNPGIGGPIMYERAVSYGKPYYDSGEEPVIVDGVTIEADNPFYWNVKSLMDEKDRYENDSNMFSSPQVLDMVLDLTDQELTYYVRFAAMITSYDDYRMDLVWGGTSRLYDKFIYENYDPDTLDILKEAISFRYGMDDNSFKEKYVDITSEERLAALDEVTGYLDTVYEVVESDDFPKYIELRIQQSNDDIDNLLEQISIQEQAIIDNPSQEENLNQYIEELNKQINMIKTNTIPILEYRLEKNIVPGEDIWENQALNELEQCRSQLTYTTIVSEEDFAKDQWMAQQYGTYAKYVAAMQVQIDSLNNRVLVAQKCLDTGKPDMKFVPQGSRKITVGFLGYSTFVALFAVLLGGWLIASEFQQGTIRLLMIRPRTRLKILMSKFLGALLLCFGIYAAGSLLNIITNGICFGFADFMFPNVTVSGPVNFFVYYLPRFLAGLVPIVFGFSIAFMLSVLIRNSAVAISVPVFCFIGCTIALPVLAYRDAANWVAWTPIPYVQISSFFADYSPVTNMIQRGVPVSLTYGILLLLGLSAVCIGVAMQVFRKRDITN